MLEVFWELKNWLKHFFFGSAKVSFGSVLAEMSTVFFCAPIFEIGVGSNRGQTNIGSAVPQYLLEANM